MKQQFERLSRAIVNMATATDACAEASTAAAALLLKAKDLEAAIKELTQARVDYENAIEAAVRGKSSASAVSVIKDCAATGPGKIEVSGLEPHVPYPKTPAVAAVPPASSGGEGEGGDDGGEGESGDETAAFKQIGVLARSKEGTVPIVVGIVRAEELDEKGKTVVKWAAAIKQGDDTLKKEPFKKRGDAKQQCKLWLRDEEMLAWAKEIREKPTAAKPHPLAAATAGIMCPECNTPKAVKQGEGGWYCKNGHGPFPVDDVVKEVAAAEIKRIQTTPPTQPPARVAVPEGGPTLPPDGTTLVEFSPEDKECVRYSLTKAAWFSTPWEDVVEGDFIFARSSTPDDAGKKPALFFGEGATRASVLIFDRFFETTEGGPIMVSASPEKNWQAKAKAAAAGLKE